MKTEKNTARYKHAGKCNWNNKSNKMAKTKSTRPEKNSQDAGQVFHLQYFIFTTFIPA